MKRLLSSLLALALLAGVGFGGWWAWTWYQARNAPDANGYRTAEVKLVAGPDGSLRAAWTLRIRCR